MRKQFTIIIPLIILTSALSSFSAEVLSAKCVPNWFSQLFKEGEWDKFHYGQEYPRFGHELDEVIGIIAEAYMASGAKGLFSIRGYNPPLTSKFIYGDDYSISGIEQSAREKYDSLEHLEVSFSDFLIIHAITKNFGEEPIEYTIHGICLLPRVVLLRQKMRIFPVAEFAQ